MLQPTSSMFCTQILHPDPASQFIAKIFISSRGALGVTKACVPGRRGAFMQGAPNPTWHMRRRSRARLAHVSGWMILGIRSGRVKEGGGIGYRSHTENFGQLISFRSRGAGWRPFWRRTSTWWYPRTQCLRCLMARLPSGTAFSGS